MIPVVPTLVLRAHAVLPACALALVLTGCGTASPRYRTQQREPAPPQTVTRDEDESAFSSRIREEAAKEDDRKVDLGSVREAVHAPDSFAVAPPVPPGVNRDSVLLDIVGYIGTPYRFGGLSKEGIDCSGFTRLVYASSLHLELPHSTTGQFAAGEDVERRELQFGDLVFFNTTGRVPSHVGVFIEDDLFAHASVTEGVTISSLESTYYKKRFVGAKRLLGSPAAPSKE